MQKHNIVEVDLQLVQRRNIVRIYNHNLSELPTNDSGTINWTKKNSDEVFEVIGKIVWYEAILEGFNRVRWYFKITGFDGKNVDYICLNTGHVDTHQTSFFTLPTNKDKKDTSRAREKLASLIGCNIGKRGNNASRTVRVNKVSIDEIRPKQLLRTTMTVGVEDYNNINRRYGCWYDSGHYIWIDDVGGLDVCYIGEGYSISQRGENEGITPHEDNKLTVEWLAKQPNAKQYTLCLYNGQYGYDTARLGKHKKKVSGHLQLESLLIVYLEVLQSQGCSVHLINDKQTHKGYTQEQLIQELITQMKQMLLIGELEFIFFNDGLENKFPIIHADKDTTNVVRRLLRQHKRYYCLEVVKEITTLLVTICYHTGIEFNSITV